MLKEARNSISDFCMNECHAYCCRKGTIPANLKELKIIGPVDTIFNGHHISFVLPCPQLINNKCMVHNEKDRPSVCKDFPITQYQGKVMISLDCFAVKENKLYSFIHKLKKKSISVLMN